MNSTININTYKTIKPIPAGPGSTTKRLKAVAKFIKKNPDAWDQTIWSKTDVRRGVYEHTCGTAGCLAGWGVSALTTKEFKDIIVDFYSEDGEYDEDAYFDWGEIGEHAFGISTEVADLLFEGDTYTYLGRLESVNMVDAAVACLEFLALVPENQRGHSGYANNIVDMLQRIINMYVEEYEKNDK